MTVMLKQAFWVAVTLLQLHASVLAFHPEDFTSDAALQCVVCNASQYCKNGVRYPCPGNSTAIQYADVVEECICNRGYEQVWRGLPMTYDFYSPQFPACRSCPNDGSYPFPQYPWNPSLRLQLWKQYAASIGATENTDAMGDRYGHPDGFGFTGPYRHQRNADNIYGHGFEKARVYFSLPLSPYHTKVKVVYRSIGWGFNLYIDNVWKQSCPESQYKNPCVLESEYTPGQVLHIRDETHHASTFLGENLYFHFTNPNPTWSCDLGLAPHWYLDGKKYTCAINRGVTKSQSSTVEDCVCLPGYYLPYWDSSAPCLPCPAGTFADKHNSSQCTPCPANSNHTSTKQTNVSACLCNAGWAGLAASGCQECAVNFYSEERNSLNCTPCPSGTATYEYPRVMCQCHAGYEPAYQVTNGATRWYSAPSENNIVQLKGQLDHPYGYPHGQVYYSYGWFACDSCYCGGGLCAWTIIDLGKIDIVVGVTIQQSHDGSTRGGQVVSRLRAEYSLMPDSGFQLAKSSYDGGFDFYPLNHFPTPHVNAFDKVHLLFEKTVRARYIRLNPMLSGNIHHGAFFRSGIITWPQYACSACALNSFKNYTGTRVVLPDKLLTECRKCPYLSSTSATGSALCSCNAGSFPDTNSTTAGQCTGCGVGVYLSNGTCQECQDNTFASALNSQMCTACNDLSYVNSHPRLFCKCKMGTTTEIVELNPLDNMRTFSGLAFTDWSGIQYARSRLDAYWIHGQGGGFGGWHSGVGGWLKMNLGSNMRVVGVVVQSGGSGYGGGYCYQAQGWMTSYSVEYSYYEHSGFVSVKNQATNDEMFYTKEIGDQEYADAVNPRCWACNEICSSRRSSGIFVAPIFAQYVKINIRGQKGNMALRAGLLIMTDKCLGCPANTFKDYDGLPTSGIGCSPCQPNSVSHPGSVYQSQCNCSAGFFKNGSFTCPSCAGGYYSPTQDVLECTKCPEHTFTDPALHPWDKASDCIVCKLCNASTNAAFTDHYDAARGGLGCGVSSVEVCTQCPSLSSLFLRTTASQRNFGVRSCVCDQNSYGVVGTACTACPVGQNRTGFIYENTTLENCQCLPGYEPDPAAANLCRKCPIGTYKPELGDHNCTVCPDTFTTEITGNSNFASCVCKPGYSLSTEQVCVICPENTHKEGFNLNTTCNACTANSFGAAGGTGPSECSCLQVFDNNADVCNKCAAGKYKNSTIKLGTAATWTYIAAQEINLARACKNVPTSQKGGCPVTAPSAYDHYPRPNLVDGNNGKNYEGIYHSADNQFNPWVMIDLEDTMSIKRVRIYNWWDYTPLFDNFEIRIGDSSIFSNNPLCGSRNGPGANFHVVKDFTCVFSGRYVSVQQFGLVKLVLQEIEVYGAKIPADERLYKCVGCPQNTFTNNTGMLACDACAVGKTTDGRIGQVECVCDVGTFLGANGTCQTCPESSFKATTTDKYANRACVNCSSCAANQQVNTECNNTHDITCRACQANSWSSAGRKLLDPCFCNAGYELQGELCVACPVGKARQANNNNSIMCEVCAAGTFTSVSTTVSCGACSPICDGACKQVLYDFTPYASQTSWKNYANSIGASYFFSDFLDYGYGYHFWSGGGDIAFFQLTLPSQYDYFTVYYKNPVSPWHNLPDQVRLLINNVVVQTASQYQSREYSKIYTPGTVLRIEELGAAIAYDIKIKLQRLCDIYVRHECNASRDVICQECQICGPGFYANNTCGANYSNDRLDTQCVSCPENYFCPGTATLQQPLLCSEQRCVANQQVATLCNTTHNITCKACQANSWSYAGRTLLDPCFCNAGYELQGELCVACPVGKARQVNNNNSIMCETCAAGSFTTVTATTVCKNCTANCPNFGPDKKKIVDFTGTYSQVDLTRYSSGGSSRGAWLAYASSIGAVCTSCTEEGWGGIYNNPNSAIIEFTLPSGYSFVETDAPGFFGMHMSLGGVYEYCDTRCNIIRPYKPGDKLRFWESGGSVTYAIKLFVFNCLTDNRYVTQECNASQDITCSCCQTCKTGLYDNNTCGVSYGNNRLDTQCVSCPENAFCPGTLTLQKPLLCSEQRCVANQQVATLCNATHNVTCKACQPNSWSYAGRTLLDPCFCNAGYELQGQLCVACPVGKARQANANNSIMCEVCAAGTFTPVSTTVSCGACSGICENNVCNQVIYDFSPYNSLSSWLNYARSIPGASAYANEWWGAAVPGLFVSSGGQAITFVSGSYVVSPETAYFQMTLPSAYNHVEVSFQCVSITHCVLEIDGVIKATATASSTPLPPYGLYLSPVTIYKQDYTPGQKLIVYEKGILGRDLKITLRRTCDAYVRHECNASRDVICQECQTCGPGFYANNTCGTNYSNDRLDTQCVPCPAGSYCPTGSGPPILCPDNGKSPLGSDDLKDCDCDPGYFRDVDGCSLCHFDYYCLGKQIQYAIACPPDSRTARRGSTSRVDCHCHTGYFRDPPERLDSFNCSLCLPGDFCFNNSAYNCSDALMVSAPGSGFFDNCTCVSGYYNNGTVCEDCPANYYCEGGELLSCPANEWTAYEGRSYECVCMPGFYRNQDLCVPCTDNYFCEGLDDSRQACPSNSVSNLAVGIEDCLCNVSYGAVFSTNVSEPHFCQLCAHTQTFKSTVGNSPCLQCTECLPHLHSAWTQIECTTRADALCDTCTVCYNVSAGIPRLKYTSQACEQFFDTECANCSVCNWDNEFELFPCSETDDATCSPITYNRQCPTGFYAGGHTQTSDSQCLPCAVHNTQYEGQWLHEFTSAGREYNNRFSCDLQCRPYSRLINNSDPSLGCTTCEIGNVLFKIFTQDTFACRFICLEGYVPVNGDCELAAAEGNELTFWNHSLNVTHVRREEQSSDSGNHSGVGAFLVTVSHTSHGHFAVVVGPTEPSCSGRSQATLSKTALSACCFDAQWRVSTANQLGLPSQASETCSRSNAPRSLRLGETQLQFEIPDTRLQELGNCNIFEEVVSCVIQISIVDIILLQHFTVPLRLEVTRSSALAITSTETYVPLSGIRVEAQLAYREANGSLIFVITTDMTPLAGAGNTEVLLYATGLDLVQPSSDINCGRLAVGNVSSASTNFWTLQAEYVRTLTFFRVMDDHVNKGSVFIKLFYTLRLVERESTSVKNTMHIAAWRNVSTAYPVCEEYIQSTTVRLGQVLSCSGLGESVVAAATALSAPTDSVHGEVGGLTSFVARSLHEHVRMVRAKYMLLAFSLPPAVSHSNITEMRMGTLEFTEAFKAECRSTSFCHFRYAQQGNGMHFMTSCDVASQNAARVWLRLALGVVHDDGHVTQLCRLSQWQQGQEYAFLITLVNTRAYLPQAPHWHDLQNRSAPISISNVFAVFEFV